MEDKIIMDDSDEAATYREGISGWVSANGCFYGEDEKLARYDGSTHKTCECGSICTKHWSACEGCREKAGIERYNKLPSRIYNGEPVVVYNDDRFFFDEESVLEYIEECEGDPMLVFCEPVTAPYIDEYAVNELPEGMYIDDADPKLAALIGKANEYIKEEEPVLSWEAGKTRAIVVGSK